MISQQINLYQERFHPQRLWFSARQVSLALACILVAGAAWSYLLHTRVEDARRQNLAIKVERDQATAELTVANAELAKLLEDDSLDLEIADAAQQVSARKKVLAFVDSNRFGSGDGFSAYLVALSKLRADDIWLSRVRFAENFVLIEGSSLSAESIPVYFERFGGEAVFRGNRFDLFQLSRASDTDWKVDFEIATSGGKDE